MLYRSTRDPNVDSAAASSFSDILLAGLAPDGGLYLPESYPRISDETLNGWRALLDREGYAALAYQVLSLYIDDIPADDLRGICARAYNPSKFGNRDLVPVTHVGDGPLWIAHISEGPTAAFKDMAMQMLGELFEYELHRRDSWITIVGATSGDTGSSAEYALRGRTGIEVFMLTPAGRMTPFQQAQMFSLTNPNIINIAVDGVFDDCQDLVKAVNADAEFKQRYRVGAVNSINWARLLAQIVYYVAAYLRVTDDNSQRVSFSVPTGNFGDICAGHIAREMGLPIDTLILATNENNVLDEFFRTGVYRPRGSAEVDATSSPSMDISKASNFERFIYDLLGRDAERTADLFGTQLREQGYFDLSQAPEFIAQRDRYGFLSGSSTHADRIETIRGLAASRGILVDPHTADAIHVAHGYMGQVDGPIIVLETALPVKFAETITEAIDMTPEVPERFAGIGAGPRRVVDLPNDVDALKTLIVARSSRT